MKEFKDTPPPPNHIHFKKCNTQNCVSNLKLLVADFIDSNIISGRFKCLNVDKWHILVCIRWTNFLPILILDEPLIQGWGLYGVNLNLKSFNRLELKLPLCDPKIRDLSQTFFFHIFNRHLGTQSLSERGGLELKKDKESRI